MAHYLFNVNDEDRDRVATYVRAKMWPVDGDERNAGALAPGDLVLIYLASPTAAFVGRAELATALYEGAVALSDAEEWDPPVPMAAVVQRIDPTGTNPVVQENAAAGFRSGVVLITEDEYGHAVALKS